MNIIDPNLEIENQQDCGVTFTVSPEEEQDIRGTLQEVLKKIKADKAKEKRVN